MAMLIGGFDLKCLVITIAVKGRQSEGQTDRRTDAQILALLNAPHFGGEAQ